MFYFRSPQNAAAAHGYQRLELPARGHYPVALTAHLSAVAEELADDPARRLLELMTGA
ncbi:hypothetical protein [Streptomyces sp. NPDC002403]